MNFIFLQISQENFHRQANFPQPSRRKPGHQGSNRQQRKEETPYAIAQISQTNYNVFTFQIYHK